VFVGTIDSRLVALAAEDGRQAWVHRASPAIAIPLGIAAPAIADGIVVAGFPSGELAALRAAEGRLLWTETVAGLARGTIADIGGIRAAPAIRDGVVYAAGLAGLTIAVDLRSGRRLWEREVSAGSTPAVAGDWAFLIAEPGRVLCIEALTGRVRWVQDFAEGLSGRRAPIRAAPLLAGGRLIVPGTDSRALLLDPANGSIAGTLTLPGPVLQAMAVADGRLVLITEDGTLAAYTG
jgi:outer membrane protein assembly factor BamB